MSRELWPAELEARDQQACTCGHRNISHASLRGVGVGAGACGYCPCDTFHAAAEGVAA